MQSKFWCILAIFAIGSVLACEWVCIDKKEDSKKLKNGVQMRYSNPVIAVPKTVEERGLPKKKTKQKKVKVDPIPQILLREPQLNAISPQLSVREPTVPVNPVELDCKDKAFTQAVNANKVNIKCTPRQVLVDIVSQEGEVIPNKVATKLCGGYCPGVKSCLATKSKNVTLSVRIKTPKGIKCSTIQVPEDQTCGCRCLETKDACTTSQFYDKRICKCSCINKDDQATCLNKAAVDNVHTWNSKACKCTCRYKKICTTGTIWDNTECRCIKRSMRI